MNRAFWLMVAQIIQPGLVGNINIWTWKERVRSQKVIMLSEKVCFALHMSKLTHLLPQRVHPHFTAWWSLPSVSTVLLHFTMDLGSSWSITDFIKNANLDRISCQRLLLKRPHSWLGATSDPLDCMDVKTVLSLHDDDNSSPLPHHLQGTQPVLNECSIH